MDSSLGACDEFGGPLLWSLVLCTTGGNDNREPLDWYSLEATIGIRNAARPSFRFVADLSL